MRGLFLAALLLAGCSRARPELFVLTWADYFAPDTISNFEKEFGCKVHVTTFDSSESLRGKLAQGASGYDVIFPSDEVIPSFIQKGYLEKLDLSKIPNLKNLNPYFRDLPYDAENQYSVAYMWGTTGIAYNKEKVSPPPDSWAALWDPKTLDHATHLDDAQEVFSAAMWWNGDDALKMTPETIERAKKKILGKKPMAYDAAPRKRLLSGQAWISHIYSGDALQAASAEERPADIGYVIPKEGGQLWVDNLCIAKGAPNPDLAHVFMNYLLRGDVSAAITEEVMFANPNDAAREHLPKEILEDPFIFPPESELERALVLPEPPPEIKKLLDAAWAEVRGQ